MVYTVCSMLVLSLMLSGCTKKKDDNRIIGGEDACTKEKYDEGECEHKWQVRLPDCGGTLIDKKWVLTSATCVDDEIDEVVVGDYDIEDEDETWEQKIKVANIYRHPDYKHMPRANDIALLELKEDVKLSKGVALAKLPTKEVGEKITVTITGWGVDIPFELKAENDTDSTADKVDKVEDILQIADFTTMSNADCMEEYKKFQSTVQGEWLKELPEKIFCASGVFNEKSGRIPDACESDFGGPITTGGEIVGVVSWGACSQTGNDTVPVIFEHVHEHTAWIEETKKGGKEAAAYCPTNSTKGGLIKDGHATDCNEEDNEEESTDEDDNDAD